MLAELQSFNLRGSGFRPCRESREDVCIRCREAIPQDEERYRLVGSWPNARICVACAEEIKANYTRHQQHIEG